MNSLRNVLQQVPAILIAVVFFALIFSLNWLGYTVRKRVSRLEPAKEVGLGAAEASLLGLMGLLLAFSFNMSASKFDNRRQTIIEEANLLRTAILRCDLYPDSIKRPLLPGFKNYLESRIRYFDAGDDPVKIQTALNEASGNFNDIWNKTLLLTKDQDNRSRAEQMIPVLISMNNMITTRETGRLYAVPTLIILVLLVLVFVAGFLTGFGTKPGNRNIYLSLAFALMTSVVLYLIMELGRPRQGYINLDNVQQKMVDLRQLFV